MKIGIVAGEESGDQLGSGLMQALNTLWSEDALGVGLAGRQEPIQFSGLGGSRMQAQGFTSIADMELLSVMGFIEPLKRLPQLFRLRRQLLEHFIDEQVDVVIGIDSPDFNLGLERRLKAYGVPICHYVCPSVWAWRQWRVEKIRDSVDHVLTLLPFEQAFLASAGIDSTFVGHPVADKFKADKLKTEKAPNHDSSATSNPTQNKKVLCVMPGSRHSELDRLLLPFLEATRMVCQQVPDLRVVIPAANQSIYNRVEQQLKHNEFQSLSASITLQLSDAHRAMAESDAVLMASGTATLEAGLLAKPMAVAYKLNTLTYWLAKMLVKVEHVSLPNLLLDGPVIPELIQNEVTAENLAIQVNALLNDDALRQETIAKLGALEPMLAKGADVTAAKAVLKLVGEG